MSLRTSSSVAVPVYLVAALIGAAILYPLLLMGGTAFFSSGVFDFSAFGKLIHTRGIGSIAWATLEYVIGSSLVATVLGAVLSWINVRTDGGIKSIAGLIPLLPIMIPPIGSALGYLVLFSSRAGVGNLWLRALFHSDAIAGPFNVTSLAGLVLVSGLSLAPVVYLVVGAALRNIDPAWEEAARISGSGPWQSLRIVTFPLVLPAISSVALLVAIQTVSTFSFPFILGTGAGVTPISVYIYRLFATFPAKTEEAIVASLILLAVVYLAIWLQSRLSRRNRYARVGGKFSAPSVVRLGRWKILTQVLVAAYFILSVLPVAGLLLGSLQPYLGATWSSLGLSNFHRVLSDPHSRGAIINSLLLGVYTASINMVVVAALLYVTHRLLNRARWIEYVLMAPSVMPHIVVGVAFALTYSMAPFHLQGTLTLVLLAYCVIFLPETVRSSHAALGQLNPELSEASHVFGAGALRTFFTIVLPQVKGGIAAGWLIIFLIAVNEVTASTFLGGFNSAVVGYVAIDYFTNGRLGEVATITLTSTVVTAGFVLLVSKALNIKVAKA